MSAALAIVPRDNVEESASTARVITLDLDNAAHLHRSLMQFRDECLTRGVDYGVIQGTPRNTLYKPGAEKLMHFFSLGLTLEITSRLEDWKDNQFAYEVKAILRSKRSGEIEAEGIGNCNSKERKYKNQDGANVANTLLKMAKKRALIDAVLTATRSSGLFEDEDADYDGPRQHAAPTQQTRQQNAPRQQAAPPATPSLATRSQLDRCERARKRAVELGYRVGEKLPRPVAEGATVREAGEKCAKWESYIKEKTAQSDAPLLENEAAPVNRGPRFIIPKHMKNSARNCTSCGAQIWFLKNPDTDKTVPVGADGYSHFTSCPQASQHSKKNAPTSEAAADQPLWDGDNHTPSEARNAKVAAEQGYANATPINATPRPQIGMSPSVKRLWAVISERDLPVAKDGAERDERLEAANQALEAKGLATVISFSELSDIAARYLTHEIEQGRLFWGTTTKPEGA